MSAIAFAQIPINWRDPGVYMEVDPTFADSGIGSFPLRALIIAQKTSAGTGQTFTPHLVTSAGQAEELGGVGSMASRMCAKWLDHNRVTETDLMLVDDLGGGAQATATMTFSGTVSPATLNVYIGGDRVPVAISQGDTTADIALEVVTSVTATHGLAATAAVNPGLSTQVIFTARNKGEVGNTIDIRTSHLDGEADPPALGVAVVAMSGGTGNNTAALPTVFASVVGVQYDIIVHPYVDAASLTAIEDEMANRADALNAIPGSAISAHVGSQGVLSALGNGRNSEFSTLLGFETFPGVPCERAASIAGLVARYGANDPARPFQTLAVNGYAPAKAEQFSATQRNMLMFDGISTVVTGAGAQVRIGRLITTYTTTAGGAPSEAFLDLNTLLTLSFTRKSFVARFSQRFPRSKLANDGGGTPSGGSALVTPSVAKAEAVAWYSELVAAELVQDLEGFKTNSIFQVSAADPTRLDTVLAIYLVNPLRVTAALNQFRR